MDIDTPTFTLLYSVFAWANIFLNLIGGYMVDKYLGIELGAVICCCFTVAGQALLGVGAYVNKFWVMLLARLVFAVGSDNLTLVGYMRAIKWFPENELNFVFGLQLSVNRFGSTLNFILMEPLYNRINRYISGHKCLGITFMIVALLPTLDLILAILLGLLDRRAAKMLDKTSDEKKNVRKSENKISVKDIVHFRFDYWSLIAVIVFNYSAVFPFISLGIPFYKKKFSFTDSEANLINSSTYFISIFASPIMGVLISRIGEDMYFLLISVLVTTVSHLILCFTLINPWLSITLMGIAYSIFACIVWTLVSVVVPERTLGTAFGISQALINLILGLIDIAVGYIIDRKGYFFMELFFIEWLLLTLIVMMALMIYDNSHDNRLSTRSVTATDVPRR